MLNCESQKQQHKDGKTKSGSHRYRCYSGGSGYAAEKKVQGYGQALRQKAIQMYIDGAGLRRTGRHLAQTDQDIHTAHMRGSPVDSNL